MAHYLLAIDPGAVWTGVAISQVVEPVVPDWHESRAPLLVVRDAFTVGATAREKTPKRAAVTGLREFSERVVNRIDKALAKHGIDESNLTLVCLESLYDPKESAGFREWGWYSRTSRVLGYLEGVYDKGRMWSVPPAGKWPDLKDPETGKSIPGGTGWDAAHKHEWSPAELTGRRDPTWSESSGHTQIHARSAWHMGRAGWRKWWVSSSARGTKYLPADLAARQAEGVERVERIAGAIRVGEPVGKATIAEFGTFHPYAAAAAAELVQPGAGDANLTALRAKANAAQTAA